MIVFCVTCKNRVAHLELTLPKNLADNVDYPACKFVVLDYHDSGCLPAYLKAHHQADIDSGRLVVYSLLPPDSEGGVYPFRMAHAKNLSHRLGILEGGDILCNLDADNFTCPGFAAYIASVMRPDAYLWARMQKGKLKRGISGRIAINAAAFRLLGGYDEKFETWSPDDKDMSARLQRLGYNPIEIPEQFLDAIQHNHKLRFSEYKHASTLVNEDAIDIDYDEATIANFGNFGCATVYRNFDFDNPIELKPLPTRIFGVGLHKTGTTSLHEALTILGYDSSHWPSAHWARAVYQEMVSMGKSTTLERHYAASDLPIALLYRELDMAYPGSRFILTVRDEDAWIDSVRRHWDPATNPFRKSWNHDPASHFLHKQLYGRKDFDRDTMLARYRRHNAEVREHFKDRPDDLLVLRVGDGWEKLCRFLGRSVPDSAYPWSNGTRSHG